MPVEKMIMISAIGSIEDIDEVSNEMVKCGCIHVTAALDDIYKSNNQNKEISEFIRAYKNQMDCSELVGRVDEIIDICSIKKIIQKKFIKEDFNPDDMDKMIKPIYEEASGYSVSLENANDELNKLTGLMDNMRNIRDVKVPLSDIKGLNFFSFSMGKVRQEYYGKLKENIENIPSIIYEVSSNKDSAVIISFTPKADVPEVKEIFKSLGYEEINIPEGVEGVPQDILSSVEVLIKEKKEEIEGLKEHIKSIRHQHEIFIIKCYSLLEKFRKMQGINESAACTNYVFYVSGWIPNSIKDSFVERLKGLEDKIILVFRDQSEIKEVVPPTNLKNSRLWKPFEYLVYMYGIPTYDEIDPTFFVSITYMIMFGAMFGDVGQGAVLILGGFYLSIMKKSYEFGGILTRVGTSSVIFGFLYGSVFGNEEIFQPLLIRPLENVNLVLLVSVLFGILLSTICYVFNFINSVRRREIEAGLFEEGGLVGFIFYWIILLTIYSIYVKGSPPVPIPIIMIILAALLISMILRQPLSRLIEGKRPLHEGAVGDYYVESIFGAVESILTMLSKTVSFVRIGAFAMNHVGLFVAFATLAALIRNKAGSIGVLVLGNIVIIGLEGLIVFIQCLRLEYYELFGRFYRGNGIRYEPVGLIYDENKKQSND